MSAMLKLRQLGRATESILHVKHNLNRVQLRGLPSCILDTNLNESQIPHDIHKQLSETLANTLKKDPNAVSVSIRPSTKMWRRGTDEPAAVVNVWSIGVFNAKSNPGYARDIYKCLSPALQIPPNRIMLMFHPVEQSQVGVYLTPELMNTDKPL